MAANVKVGELKRKEMVCTNVQNGSQNKRIRIHYKSMTQRESLQQR